MAFNSSTHKVATKSLVKVLETNVTGRLLIEDENIIDRVLGCLGYVQIANEDRVGDSVQLSGSVNLSVMYTQGSKSITSGRVVVDFVERFDLIGVENVSYLPTIKSYKATKESDKSIVVSVSIETQIFGVRNEEFEILTCQEPEFFSQTKTIALNRLIASANTSFSVSEAFDIENCKVLGVQAKTIANKIIPFDNFATIEGNCLLDVVILQNDNMKTIQKSVNFVEEVPVLNLKPSAVLDALVIDRFVNFSTEILGETSMKLLIDVGIGLSAWGFETENVEIITDAFSTMKNMGLAYSQVFNTQVAPVKLGSDRATITINVENKKRIDEILYVGQPFARIEDSSIESERLNAKGKICIPVVFKNYDSDEILGVTLEDKFEFSCELDCIGCDVYADVISIANVCNFKNKAGKEISFVVDLNYVVSTRTQNSEIFVSKVEELGGCEITKSEIVVYKPLDNESVFDIAKSLQISPDVLRLQNPHIEDGKEIKQVVVYRKCR